MCKMKCPICGSTLIIGKQYYTTKGDDNPDTPTEIYTNSPMLCTNKSSSLNDWKPCPNYGGEDLGKPLTIVTTITNRVG